MTPADVFTVVALSALIGLIVFHAKQLWFMQRRIETTDERLQMLDLFVRAEIVDRLRQVTAKSDALGERVSEVFAKLEAIKAITHSILDKNFKPIDTNTRELRGEWESAVAELAKYSPTKAREFTSEDEGYYKVCGRKRVINSEILKAVLDSLDFERGNPR